MTEIMNDEPLISENLIKVGTIVSPQGIKGELKVYADSDFPERFINPGIRWLQHPQTQEITEVELLKGRVAKKNLYVIKLAGIDNRDRAEELRQSLFLADKRGKPALAPDEYHVADLIDLEVYDRTTGENIGVTVEMYTAGNDILEVKLHRQPDKQELPVKDNSSISRKSKRKRPKAKASKPVTVFIPFVKEIVPVVDLKNKRLEILPPPGLLEINRS
ncbi:ribosome maturation factor RimM [Myxosarcina sp. GI1]|uniref:ribosome maturation factor RimM n=1 Tax=Myxosarcina sp. GI1 TaxID=1541065 RepID=UPI0020A081A6|nr:ribosome maturation factor RimM [Myxosarcina sp. GI1]